MDTNENVDYITTTECDCCHARRPVLLHHHNGTPVLAVCQACGPINFDLAARVAIDAWLAGDDSVIRGC